MALFVIGERTHQVTGSPYQLLFGGWRRRLEAVEIQAINFEFDRLVRTTRGSEIWTAGWLPREITPLGHHDWDGSPLMKIWTKACDGDRARTCWCFALLLWEHMMNRPEAWHFKIGDLENAPMAATRYYRCPQRRSGSASRPAAALTQ